MTLNRLFYLTKSFRTPLLVLVGILVYLLLSIPTLYLLPTTRYSLLPITILLAATFLGSFGLFKEIVHSLRQNHFALDYIAVLAVATSLISGEFLVAAIIALMLSSGETLENYGISQAKKSLSRLVDRIPQDVYLIENGQPSIKQKINQIKLGQEILIRKGEVIPLDGTLVSNQGYTDESSLTGEPYFVEKLKGDLMRSGTINTGESITIKVTKVEADSTYKKIINMVQKAQSEKSPFIRLADKYSAVFTVITFILAAFAFSLSPHLKSILAVLVIATPCPLIIATPIALLGGVNKAAKKRIIIKKLAGIEALARTNTFVFDKTGTITLGKPTITNIEIIDPSFNQDHVLTISHALERNSLHPIAKTIIEAAHELKITPKTAADVEETIGKGISGTIDKKRYTLTKRDRSNSLGMEIELLQDKNLIAIFHFEDTIKKESRDTMRRLKNLGEEIYIFTGDKQEVAEKITSQLGTSIHILANLKPEDKAAEIKKLKNQNLLSTPYSLPHRVIAFIGDGINDAPALALADVGLVFSNEEQTAASEAADIVLLGGDFSLVTDSIDIAKRTISIATQSILAGIGISIIGMIIASFGLIPPLIGAALQETIDVAVILNALRASR